jgi:uncharacterized membrane protein
MTLLILGLLIFLAMHLLRLVAPGFVAARKAQMSEGAWKGVYSLVSLVGIVLIVFGFAATRADATYLYSPSLGQMHAGAGLMLFSMLLLGVFNGPAGRLKPLIRHPMMLAVLLWSVAHLLANGDLASVVLFGTFFVWSAIYLATGYGPRTEPATAGPVMNDLIGIVIGLAIYGVLVMGLHRYLFGVSPFPG